jgi:hypothetical protein
MEPQIRKVMPPLPGSSIDYDEAVASWKKIAEEDRQRRLRRNAGRRADYRARKREAAMEPQIRKVMPPHPGASITVEQAKAAFIAVEEEQRQAQLRKNAARRAAYRARKATVSRQP